MKLEIIDAKEPKWRQRASERVDLNQRFKVINLRLDEHEEDIRILLAYYRSKRKTPERFEGIFDCDGMEF